jgi:hypothetical protein
MANNTNIQFYTDSRIVFETSDGTGKTAIGSANDTVQGFEIEYNLGATGEAFKISPLGINYTYGPTGATGSINYTTSLPRIAQVGSLIQSLETPPDATTLQVDKRILLTDGISSGSIGISGTNTLIDATGNLILGPVGLINTNGSTIDMTNGQISNCSLLQGVNNTNIIVEGKGTGHVVLKTGGVNRLDITETGAVSFDGGMTYDNATNTVSATNFVGLVSDATDSVNAERVFATTDFTSDICRLTFAKDPVTGYQPLFIDTGAPVTYIPSTGILSFPVPPTTNVSATANNQLVNFNNFAASSYTPIIFGSSVAGSPTYVTQNGSFIKINNCCFYQSEVEISAINDMSGNLAISLPFTTIGTASFPISNVAGLGPTGGVDISCSAQNDSTAANLAIRTTVASTSVANLTQTLITDNFRISFGGNYFVA